MINKIKNIASICVCTIIILFTMTILFQAQEIDVRSDIHDLGEESVTWDCYTFPGFYYDIDNDIGTENLTFMLSNIAQDESSATLSDQPDAYDNRSIVYTTEAKPVDFSFGQWGQYEEIGFIGRDYFAAYDSNVISDLNATNESVPFLFDKSENRNLMTDELISELLNDDNTEQKFDSSNPLELDEGYNLSIESIDSDSKKVYLELSKNGKIVDNKIIQPSIENANIGDQTYYYKKDLGGIKGIVIIAVHFKNVFSSSHSNIATVDGIFQISDTPTALTTGQQYNKMSIRLVDPTAMTITMDNKDNPITLTRNKDIALMDNIHIKTADQDDTTASNPLRYYIYSNESCECD
jgi:S-layer protein (TIGR01567 family)